ncbi:hypothetical protein SGQ83_05885 [Flavobacterium sp. Fl-318]|jgi:hypothetical protein|uniref:BppU N-terminal domain-containing protein n=1 Tax=Flavobacterium cupriresistens TaxID=2893885 RepID=A0ABU4R8F5_9FLAO|nr:MULTISPECIES: hypothetical protein [unclassified Flavobacterium]MDX6188871.1 hypothetical protein [Flavobacterium sp. Fl-318]UFH44346.1 hypothetical protein LNP23_09020 [Flavobacterium sp. F-323]
MITKTTLDTLYLINDSNRMVSVEIVIGDQGQTSSLIVSLNDEVIVPDPNSNPSETAHSGNLPKTAIKENKLLHGKNLKIQAVITDTSKETNITSLTVKLSGGFITRTYPLYKMVDKEGESADYYCYIEFTNSTKL